MCQHQTSSLYVAYNMDDSAQLHSKQGIECPCQIKYKVPSAECGTVTAMNDGVDTTLEVI